LMWLKNRFDRLQPEAKKKLLWFGLSNVFAFFKARWFWVLTIVWQIVKKLFMR